MKTFKKDDETITVQDIDIQDGYVTLSWGSYTRVMTVEEFNLYLEQ